MARRYLEIAVTPAALAAQEHYYGRSRPTLGTSPDDPLGPREQAFINARDSFYMATVTDSGWPYVQHRGGPVGFLRVVGPQTLAFADLGGNRQLVSVGNLAGNDRVALFLMDYPNRVRLKLLAHARVEDARSAPAVAAELAEAALVPLVERIVFLDVVSFDWNCPKYITERYSAAEVETLVQPLLAELEDLRRRVAASSASGNTFEK